MSKWLESRRPDQCSTHHQKMIGRYRTVDRIIKEVPKRFQDPEESVEMEKEQKSTSDRIVRL